MQDAPSLDKVTGEEINELLTEIEVEVPDGEVETLAQIGVDIVTAHEELEQFRRGSLAMVQALDEAIIEYEQEGDEDAVEALKEVKHASYGVYLRLTRGDAELMGDRDGKYSGYFESEKKADEKKRGGGGKYKDVN